MGILTISRMDEATMYEEKVKSLGDMPSSVVTYFYIAAWNVHTVGITKLIRIGMYAGIRTLISPLYVSMTLS
jgi:hypothetical protein